MLASAWSWASAAITPESSNWKRSAARRHDHRSRQQVAHASAGFVGPLRNGARSGGDHAWSCAIREARLLPRAKRRSRSRSKISLCARATARWFSKTSRCSRRRLWLQYRLEAIGLNAINNIVDVTNYVMAELAQPMHAFDAEKLHGETIFVRSAQPGEQIRRVERRKLRLEPVESGDRRCRRSHCARGRDRRSA